MKLTMKMLRAIRSILFQVAASILLIGAASGADQPPLRATGGFVVAGHAWTWNKGTLFDAIDQTAVLGLDSLEIFLMGMRISAETGDAVLDDVTPEALIARIREHAKAKGVKFVAPYIGGKQWTRIGQDEGQLRRFFEQGKKLGVSGFTGEPMESQWDMLEKLLKEFDFTFAIHNHAIGFEADYFGGPYPYGNPAETAKKLEAQHRDKRMGICFDTGHAARSGLDIVEVTRACAGRLRSLHLKDVARVQVNDVPFGTGRVNIAAVLAELRHQGFQGHIGLEYENFESPTFGDDLRQMVRFVREQGK
jgi:sugar phosphate isomerase/epimerase